MVSKNKKGLIFIVAFLQLFATITLSAQENSGQTDSLVRLMNAQYIEQYEEGDDLIRKAVDATFLHNGTYLICDSSFWSSNRKIINCIGNVRLIQGDTELNSEKLDYFIDDDLAQFRGSVVELRDEDNNILRTKILDYNTKDSIAVFSGGASMISNDGQIIESLNGNYFNALSLFTFEDEVDMFTDSVFVKTNSLEYDSDVQKAHFTSYIDFWKDDNMLSAEGGWYDRNTETFFFKDNVHGLTKTQESWSDTLYYYRNLNNVKMLGRVQVQDSTRSAAALSNYLFYEDSLSMVTIKDSAAVSLWEERDGKIDTTYFGGNTISYKGIRRCDLTDADLSDSKTRLETIMSDPVAEFRRKAAQEAAKKREEAQTAKRGGAPLPSASGSRAPQNTSEATPPASEPKDSSSVDIPDSLALGDTLAVDTTRVGLITAIGKVRVFRSDMQIDCDSMVFSELDSIARFYRDPIVWNETNRQYSSDSLFVLINNKGIDRASLMSNAFIAIQESADFFDQIRSSEAMAYFDSTAALSRFDALGGINALFCLEENDTIATINKVEGRMLSATLKNGEIDRVYYFEKPKNDAYPVVQLPESERSLKGFNWRPERRPMGKEDITDLVHRPSERSHYLRQPKTRFSQTERFFPGYMGDLYDELERARLAKRMRNADSEPQPADSLAPVLPDSLAVKPDSLDISADSLSASVDSLSAPSDSSLVSAESLLSDREIRRAERDSLRAARWAELDAIDAAKEAEKAKKKAEREAKKLERAKKRRAKQEARDYELLLFYIDYYTKEKIENERKQELDSSRERSSRTETRGELSAPSQRERKALGGDPLLGVYGPSDDRAVLGSGGISRT